MKKLILLFLVAVIGYSASAQPGYTRINSGYNWLRGAFDALNVPAGATPAKATGQYQRSGMLFYDTTGVDTGLYISHGTYWVQVGTGGKNVSLGTGFKIGVDQTNNIKSLTEGRLIKLESTVAGQISITAR